MIKGFGVDALLPRVDSYGTGSR